MEIIDVANSLDELNIDSGIVLKTNSSPSLYHACFDANAEEIYSTVAN